MYEVGKGRHRVWLSKHKIGEDLVLHVGGGDKPHVGGVVLKVPGEPLQVLTHGTHKDLKVMEPVAEAACSSFDCSVVVVGGIHLEKATKQDIQQIIANCDALALQF